MPLLNKEVIDKGILKNNLNYVLIITGISIALNLLDRGLQLIQTYYYSKISNLFSFNLQSKVFKKLLKLPLKFYNDTNATQLLSTIGLDVSNVSTICDNSVIFIVSDFLRIIGSLVGLFLISPILALLGLLVIPLKIIVNARYSTIKEKAYEELIIANEDFSNWYGDTLDGIKEIKLLGIKQKIIKKYVRLQRPIVKTNIRFNILDQWLSFWDGNLSEWSSELTFIVGAILVINQKLTFGALFAFTSYLGLVYGPLSNIISLRYMFAGFFPSAKRLKDLFSLPEEEPAKTTPALIKNDQNLPIISFHNVNFNYSDQHQTLKNVSFTINRGEKIAIIGANGSGKTTIFNLLLGFYKINSGKILINGLPIEKIPLKQLRQIITTVTQDTYLFNNTIEENLNLCLKKHQVDPFEKLSVQKMLSMLKEFPQGLATPIGQNGVQLSGGQRQKIAITRALVRNSSIILMDEATSQLDINSEHEINELLYNIDQEVTTLIITHRPYILKHVDKVIVMKDGEVIAFGKHHSLLESTNAYQQILQAHGF